MNQDENIRSEKQTRDDNIRHFAETFQKKHIVGFGKRHVGFEDPVDITDLEWEEEEDDLSGAYEPDPLALYGSAAKEQTHESILQLLERFEDVGNRHQKQKKSPLKRFRKVLSGALRKNSAAGEAAANGELSESSPKMADAVLSMKASQSQRSLRAMKLKEAVHQATEKLGAEKVLKEIRARRSAYAQVVQQLMKKQKNRTYEQDHPYVALRKKLEQMGKSGKGEYKVEYEPLTKRHEIRVTEIPLYSTNYDFNYMTKIKRIQKLLLPLIILGIVFASSAVLAYDFMWWVISFCPRCKKIKVGPELSDLPDLPHWQGPRCCCMRRKHAIPHSVASGHRFRKRRGGVMTRLSHMGTKISIRNMRMIHPDYVENQWSSLEMTAEEAFFSHSVLKDELRRLYITTRRKIIWNQFCNEIITSKQKFRELHRVVWCVIRLYRNSCMKLELNFLRQMIRQSSLVNVTSCCSKRVLGASPSQRKQVLVECLMKRVDMSRVICKDSDCDDSDDSSLESHTSSKTDPEERLALMKRETLYDLPLSSEGSSISGDSAYRKTIGHEKPSDEEIRLYLTIMVKEALDQPFEELQRKLRILRRKRFTKDLRAQAIFDPMPEEYFIQFKITVQSGELEGQSIQIRVRIIEVNSRDHFVLKRLPVPKPTVVHGIRERVEEIEGKDWTHKVSKFVIGRLQTRWNSHTFVGLKNSTQSPEKLLKNLDKGIYTFIHPLRTVVAVIETAHQFRLNKDKFRWLTPTVRRQIPMEDIPEPYSPGWDVTGVTLGSLLMRTTEQERIEKMLKDPSDIVYHSSDHSTVSKVKGSKAQTILRHSSDHSTESTVNGLTDQQSDKRQSLDSSRTEKSVVSDKIKTSSVVPAAPVAPVPKSFTVPPRMAEVVKEATIVGVPYKQPTAGHKALVFLESKMKTAGNDIFVGEARRKAIKTSQLNLQGSKINPDERLPDSSSYGVLREHWKNTRVSHLEETSSNDSGWEIPIVKKPSVIVLATKKSPAYAVTSKAPKQTIAVKESKQGKHTTLAVPTIDPRMSLQPLWSQGDERLGSKLESSPRAVDFAVSHDNSKNFTYLDYSNLKNDNHRYIYYSVGRMLIVERRDRIIFSMFRGEDSIASPSSSIKQVFSTDTNRTMR